MGIFAKPKKRIRKETFDDGTVSYHCEFTGYLFPRIWWHMTYVDDGWYGDGVICQAVFDTLDKAEKFMAERTRNVHFYIE